MEEEKGLDITGEILSRLDLTKIVAEYVTLKKSGRSLKGLCPFHQEDTPSFFVSPEKQVFYCFGCGAGGNVITFLKNIEKVSYGEALELAAQRAGITLASGTIEGNKEKNEIYQANLLAAKFYQSVLFQPEGKDGLDYLTSRNLGEEEIKRYGLGYAPGQPDFLVAKIKKEGWEKEHFKKAGLIDGSEKRDVFHRRVLFPIYDVKGQVLGFGGRCVDDRQEPKYLNTAENLVFNKRRILYGLNWAREGIRETGYALIVEGYFDVLRLHKHGFRNAVAPLGTALGEGHLRLLKRFTERLLLLFDSDESGVRATLKHLETVLSNGFEVKIGILPVGFDPDRFLEDYGEQSFSTFMQNAQDFLDFSLSALSGLYQSNSPRGKARLAREIMRLIRCIPDEVERDEYRKRLEEKLQLSPAVAQLIEIAEREVLPKPFSEKQPAGKNSRQELAEKELIRLALTDKSYWERLSEERGNLTENIERLLNSGEILKKEGLPITISGLISRCQDEKLSRWLAEISVEETEVEGEKKEKIYSDCVCCLRQCRSAEELRMRLAKLKEKSSEEEISVEELKQIQQTLWAMKKGVEL